MDQPVLPWGPPRTERADASRNRQHLLATARQMLAERGPDTLTMDGLAERAGLGKGTVFRRFRTRAGIFAELLDDDERAFQRQVLSGPPPLGPGAPPPWTAPCCCTCPRPTSPPPQAPPGGSGKPGRT